MLRTYGAIVAFALLFPVLLGLMFLTPGLLGILSFLGLGAIYGVAAIVFGIAIVGLLLVSALNSGGTFHAREHVFDMLPWAVVVVMLAALASNR